MHYCHKQEQYCLEARVVQGDLEDLEDLLSPALRLSLPGHLFLLSTHSFQADQVFQESQFLLSVHAAQVALLVPKVLWSLARPFLPLPELL